MRISAVFVARATGRQALIEKFSAKLPLTMRAIQAQEETVEAYQFRRLRHIARERQAKGDFLARWRLFRAAGLVVPLVEQQLTSLLQSP